MNLSKIDARLARMLRDAGYTIECARTDGQPLTMDDRRNLRALLVGFNFDVSEQEAKVVSLDEKRGSQKK